MYQAALFFLQKATRLEVKGKKAIIILKSIECYNDVSKTWKNSFNSVIAISLVLIFIFIDPNWPVNFLKAFT